MLTQCLLLCWVVMHGLRRYLFGVVASLVSSLCFGDWMSFSCTVTVGAAGEGGKPRIRGIVTQVPSAPGLFGHAIDLGSVVAWSSGVAGSSHTLYQVCWRSGVWCCEPFGYGPYCLHPSGCPMDISAVGLSVECTLQKVTLDSVGEVTYQAVGQSGNFTVAQVALVRARIFLALMFGGFSFYLRYVRSVVLVGRLRGMSLLGTC